MQMNADEAISITVRPAVASYRGNAQLKVLVSRNERNRMLVWEVDGPNYYRSSSIPLDGAASPRSYFFIVRELPAGNSRCAHRETERQQRRHRTGGASLWLAAPG
jgi:hypothetical protein